MATAIRLKVNYSLEIIETEERRGDEPRVQFAFITRLHDRTHVDIHSGRQLANNFKGAPGSRERRTLTDLVDMTSVIPTREEPFFGIVARAFDNDKSYWDDRNTDTLVLKHRLEFFLYNEFRDGRTPAGHEVWPIANAAPIKNPRGLIADKDDKIGVSARVFPDLGEKLANARTVAEFNAHVDDRYPLNFEFRFKTGAHYLLRGTLSAE